MTFHQSLLDWYDQTHRHLPWRANPGQVPNPYYVLLSEIMLQQTTVATIIDYFKYFINKWPTIEDFATATQDEIYHAWQGLGYYSRARNLHKCTQIIVSEYHNQVPQEFSKLLTLPGIGPYTAAAIASIAYDQPIVPVDSNIVRVFSRVLCLEKELPQLLDEVRLKVKDYVPIYRRGDFAQALMDLGATICKPNQPLCSHCPVQSYCLVAGTEKAKTLPRKKAKPPRPVRYGITYWYMNKQNHVWLRRRPEKGLLANLMEFPGTAWHDHPYEVTQTVSSQLPLANWNVLPNEVIHTFTHFQLRLIIVKAMGDDQPGDLLVNPENLDDYALPTLMRKVAAHVEKHSKIT